MMEDFAQSTQIAEPPLAIIQPEVEGEQAISDASAMQSQMQSQEIPPLPDDKVVGITSGLSGLLSKQIAKRKELAKVGKKQFEQREVEKIEEDVTTKATELEEAEITDFDTKHSHQFNFDLIQDVDDVAAEFAKMNEVNKEAINTQRRNVIPDKELNDLANTLSSDPATIKKVLGLKEGEILGPEYVLSMKQTLKQSVKRLKEMSQKIVSGEASDNDKVAFHKQWEFHSQFTTQFMGVRAEYGRGFRALGLNPTETPSELNELMDRMSAGTLDPTTMAQQIIAAADDKSITKMIQNQKGLISKVGDVTSELFISSILSGVQTHIVNTSSNAFKAISMPLDTAVASMFKADGTNVISKGEGMAQLKGMWEANIEAIDIAWRVLKTGEAYGGIDKMDVDYQKAISANALGIKEGKFATTVDNFGKFVRLSTDNLMGAEDAYFKVLNERGKLRQLAHRKAQEQGLSGEEYNNFIAHFMDNPTKSAHEEATQAGLEGTFQQRLGGAGQGIQKAREKIWGGKLIMPFVKTPINLLYEGFVERTPMGLLSEKFKGAIAKGGAEAQMAKAKMTIGTSVNTAVIGTFWGLENNTESGIQVHGAYPSNPQLRASMKEAGIEENSFSITTDEGKKRYVSFNRLEPFNSVFKLYANITQVQKIASIDEFNPDVQKEYEKMVAGVTLAFAEATVNQTFMKGVKDVLDALTAGTSLRAVERIATNYANALLVPHSSALKNITRAFDDQIKDADKMMEKIRRNTPFVGKDTYPILDNYGKPLKVENNFLPSFYKPGKEGSTDIVRNEVYRIAETTKTIPVFKPKKNFGGYRMTAEQYYIYTNSATNDEIDGLKMYDRLKKAIQSPQYKRQTDYQRSIHLNAIRNAYYDHAKYKVLFAKFPAIQQYDIDKKEYKNRLLMKK